MRVAHVAGSERTHRAEHWACAWAVWARGHKGRGHRRDRETLMSVEWQNLQSTEEPCDNRPPHHARCEPPPGGRVAGGARKRKTEGGDEPSSCARQRVARRARCNCSAAGEPAASTAPHPLACGACCAATELGSSSVVSLRHSGKKEKIIRTAAKGRELMGDWVMVESPGGHTLRLA